MKKSNLRTVERKVLGALIQLANDDMSVEASHGEIALRMGYKKTGGMINYALDSLEIKNYITKVGKDRYTVLI